MSRSTGSQSDNEPLQPAEYLAVLMCLPYHWQMLYRVLWETGIRIGEAVRLGKKDLLPDGSLQIRRLKKGASPRMDKIPLPELLAQDLREYAASVSGPLLFPYTKAAAWLALKKAAAKAGIRASIHPHSFRHGFARRVARADFGLAPLDQLATLQAMLGHSDIRTTSVYFKPGQQELKDAWDKLNRRVQMRRPGGT